MLQVEVARPRFQRNEAMLIISNQQRRKMNELRAHRYHMELLTFFRANATELLDRYHDREALELIAESVDKARTWGLNSGGSIAEFVALGLVAGLEFADDSKVKHFQNLPGDTKEQKIHRLLELVAAELIQYEEPKA